jgi:lipase
VNEPVERRVRVNGIELAYVEWRAASHEGGRVFLFAHATGFHARIWNRTIAALEPGNRVISFDLRGHGRSEKRGPFGWETFGHDIREAIIALDLERIVGVGHSMGGHAMTQAAAYEEARFDRLLLVDPVILDPAYYAERQRAVPDRPEEHPTSKRRNEWASWREMFERFEVRHPFNLWRPDVLEDYCRFGLLPNPDGPGLVLACPPRVEASIYTESVGRDIYPLIRRMSLPVTVLRGAPREAGDSDAMDFATSPTWSALAAQFPRGHDVSLPHLTHFIPMQEPELVARYAAHSPSP